MSTAPPPPSGEDPPLTDGAADDGAPDQRGRFRHRRLTVLAVATAVVLAGGGTVYWASGTDADGDPAAADQPPQKLALDGYSAQEGSAPGSQRSNAEHPEYRAVGELPDDAPEDAPLYRVSESVDEDTVRDLAEALDVPGTPRAQNGGWRAGGTADGEGPVLRVRDAAPHTWTYAKLGGTVRPQDEPASDASVSSSTSRERRDAIPAKDTSAVSEQRAKQAAEPVLEALGLSDAPVDAERTLGAVRLVTVDPEYGDLPTQGWQTVLQIGADGDVVRAGGKLVTAEEGPRYPILSAEKALKELNERGGALTPPPCAEPPIAYPQHAEGAESERSSASRDAANSDTTSSDAMPRPDSSPASDPPPRLLPCATSGTVQVTGAELGLASHTSKGEPVLVPSWMFEVKTASGGTERTVAYPAVEPRYLTLSASSGTDGTEAPGSRDGRGDQDSGAGTRPGDDGKRDDASTHTANRVGRYSAEDRTLTLHFWGGVCTEYTGAVAESDGQVRVTIEGRSTLDEHTYCVAIAKQQSVKVKLDEPIGERTIVNDKGEPLSTEE